jgi:hypothetical protein
MLEYYLEMQVRHSSSNALIHTLASRIVGRVSTPNIIVALFLASVVTKQTGIQKTEKQDYEIVLHYTLALDIRAI